MAALICEVAFDVVQPVTESFADVNFLAGVMIIFVETVFQDIVPPIASVQPLYETVLNEPLRAISVPLDINECNLPLALFPVLTAIETVAVNVPDEALPCSLIFPPVVVVVLKLPVVVVNVTLWLPAVADVIASVATAVSVPCNVAFAEVAPAVWIPAKVMPVTGIRNAAPTPTARKSLLFNVFLL
jgi:hypothetical protein